MLLRVYYLSINVFHRKNIVTIYKYDAYPRQSKAASADSISGIDIKLIPFSPFLHCQLMLTM
jgi:hypothetical protein